MPQGNSLYGYHKQVKMSFCFSFTKFVNRKAEQILLGMGGSHGRRGEW
jgi:hypothetical protein